MYDQRDTPVPKKHHADYRDKGNWGTTKTRKIYTEWSIALNHESHINPDAAES